MSKLAIINAQSAEKTTIGDGENFNAKVAQLAPLFKMKGLGCGVVELAPGNKGWPYHLHYGQEELFIILQGKGSIRYDDEIYPVESGDIIFTPPGEGTAHQIINSSDEPLQYIAISTRENPEFCYYPDSDKYASFARSDDGGRKAFIAHKSSEVGYFEGEDS